MNRRSLLSAIALSSSLAFMPMSAIAGANSNWVKDSFASLSQQERERVQSQLKSASLYQGDIDGAFGPATLAAIMSAPDYLEKTSEEGFVIPLQTQEDVSRFLKEMAGGDWQDHFSGELSETSYHQD